LQIGVFIEKVNNQKRQHRLIIIATAMHHAVGIQSLAHPDSV